MRQRVVVRTPKGKRFSLIRLGVGISYSERDGGPVRRTETHWTKISGIWINTPVGCWWIRFRRFGT